jgi:hypothetical protein
VNELNRVLLEGQRAVERIAVRLVLARLVLGVYLEEIRR